MTTNDSTTAEPFSIELLVRDPADVFETPDPPLADTRTLHPQIRDALLEQWGHAPRGASLKLIVRWPATFEVDSQRADPNAFAAELRDYFIARIETERREIRHILRDGRTALLIGLTFLFVATALAELIHGVFTGRLGTALANGLEIFGWVALWRPAELLLYDWVPVRRRLRLLRQLSVATIDCRQQMTTGR